MSAIDPPEPPPSGQYFTPPAPTSRRASARRAPSIRSLIATAASSPVVRSEVRLTAAINFDLPASRAVVKFSCAALAQSGQDSGSEAPHCYFHFRPLSLARPPTQTEPDQRGLVRCESGFSCLLICLLSGQPALGLWALPGARERQLAQISLGGPRDSIREPAHLATVAPTCGLKSSLGPH